jgi:phenylacetyl-CoA:acceptor oxidoreductase subunit 2
VQSRFGRAMAGLDAAAVVLAVVAALGLRAGWLAGAAALLVIAAGWSLKFTIVIRAAYNQGFALPATPERGAGGTHAGARPGW